jgi:hypothetical protein
VGAVEFDLIGLGGEDAQLELRQGEEPGLVHSFEPGPSPRVAHVRTAFERPGSCVIRLRAPGLERSPEIRIEVGPPSVSVLERLPWILAWIPMCLLLWMRSRALRSRLYTPGRR